MTNISLLLAHETARELLDAYGIVPVARGVVHFALASMLAPLFDQANSMAGLQDDESVSRALGAFFGASGPSRSASWRAFRRYPFAGAVAQVTESQLLGVQNAARCLASALRTIPLRLEPPEPEDNASQDDDDAAPVDDVSVTLCVREVVASPKLRDAAFMT
jgi:hypothetical protein